MRLAIQLLLLLTICYQPVTLFAEEMSSYSQWCSGHSEPAGSEVPPWDEGEEFEQEVEGEDKFLTFPLTPADPFLLSICHRETETPYRPPFIDGVLRPPQS